MLSLFTFLLILLAFFSFYLYKLWQYDKKLPPGPWGPSIFSYAALLKRNAKSFNILAEKYGQIFSVRVGTQLVVILNDYDAIRDTFIKQGDIFAGRPLMFTLTRGTQRKGMRLRKQIIEPMLIPCVTTVSFAKNNLLAVS